ncbi:MAG: SpoIIE family protein phosphatase [Candidatus Izemoplasmataceae bacterium]
MSDLTVETHTLSLNKKGEELCGDHVACKKVGTDTILVLADGLGSGVKANILSTLSSTMIATMVGRSVPLEDVMDTVLKTLPVCKVRGIAYSTFTVFHIKDQREVTIINYDNPKPIVLRDGHHLPLDYRTLLMNGREVSLTTHILKEGDSLMAMSDGCVHAGVGAELNFGWQRPHIIEYLESMYLSDYSARMLAELLIDECDALYHGHPGDDTTALAIKVKKRKPLNVFVGPPGEKKDDEPAIEAFLNEPGKKIICGGSTAQMFARFLNAELEVDLHTAGKAIPPTARMEGIDLVSEGIVTLSYVLKRIKAIHASKDRFLSQSDEAPVRILCSMLLEESTDIHFYVGTAINPAHQNPDLPVDMSLKMRIIDDLKDTLEAMGKRIRMSQY